MMESVGILIFNTLAGHGRIVLPGIGTLGVVTAPAETNDRGEVIPPRNRVELLRDEMLDAPHVVDLLARRSGLAPDDVRENYNAWLAEACTEEGVCIGSVGQIRDDAFFIAPELEQVLNPVGTKAEKLPAQLRPGQVAGWIAGAVLLGALLSFGVIAWLEHGTRPRTTGPESVPPAVVAAEKIQPVTTVGTDSATVSADTTVTPEPSPAASGTSAAETTPQPQQNEAVQPAPTAVAGNYYVIAGTFSTEENADRFIASARKIDDSLPFRKIPQRNGRIMVSIFGSDSQQKAVRKKREYEAIFEGVWIHRAR